MALDPIRPRRAALAGESAPYDPLTDLVSFADVKFDRLHVKSGAVVFSAGDKFDAIYAIRSGFFKTADMDANGRQQVMGFFMRGEIIGLDGIGSGYYLGTATALEDSEIVVLPFALLEDLSRRNQAMQRQLHAVLSREITRHHGVMMLLGTMTATERVAVFLVNLSMRFARRGYSPSEFILRMTREEIGRHLGLQLETVSRVFSRFQMLELLEVNGKHVRIRDPDGLRRVLQKGERRAISLQGKRSR